MKQFFSKILWIFKQGWFLSLMGILILSIVIYFIAPLISDSKSTLITIGGIASLIIIWLIVQLVRLLHSRKENAAVLDSLQGIKPQEDYQPAVDEELEVLQERMSGAVSELKNSRFGKKGGEARYLYQIPWYILIGPPASGKTTLLKNSSLKTALSKKFGRDSISGMGGTRHCDWWFAEQAVLLDTAGRYTTQDSHKEKDAKAWQGFLELLKRNRTRRPINGVIIAISLDELLLSQAGLHEHAKEIRERIQELYEQFSLTLPIYLVFTKSDLLAGFSEFFYDLDKSAREQVWGITFTNNNSIIDNPLEWLQKELDLLEGTLKEKLLHKLERETDLERRKKIYAFPEQFASIKNSVTQFAHEVFSESRYQHKSLLRGVYFTSAEQTGSPIDKLLANLAHTFGFEQAPMTLMRARGKSYFIDNLLQKVIFPESELAGLNSSYERKKRFMQWGMIGSAVLMTLIGTGLWLTSYQANMTAVKNVNTQTETLEKLNTHYKNDNSITASLSILNQAASLYQPEEGFLATSLGLNQHEKLLHQTANTYRDALLKRLLPFVLTSLEQGMQDNSQDTSKLFSFLKGYLILAPHHGDYYANNSLELQKLLLPVWEKTFKNNVSPEGMQQLHSHLEQLLTARPILSLVNLKLDQELIDKSRETLLKQNVSELIYGQIKQKLKQSQKFKDFVMTGNRASFKHADKVFERDNGELFDHTLSGLFTYEGYTLFDKESKQLVRRHMNNNWVLGSEVSGDVNTLYYDVRSIFLEEYQATWDTYLSHIKTRPLLNLNDAANLLSLVKASDSPMKGLLTAVSKETHLSKSLTSEGAKQRAVQEAQREIIKKTGRIGSIVNNIAGGQAISSLTQAKGDDVVTLHFQEVRELIDKDSQSFDRFGQLLGQLSGKLRDLHTSVPNDEGMHAKKKEIKKLLDGLQSVANTQPIPLRTWLLEIRMSVSQLLEGNFDKTLDKLWKSRVLDVYQRKIKNRYPLRGNPSKSIPSGDFSRFFGPDGIMESFFEEHLAATTDQTGKNWKSVDSIASPVSDRALKQFQLAGKIRDSFFPESGHRPSMTFILKPIETTFNVLKVSLDLDGTKLNYNTGGTARPISMSWPGPGRTGYVSLQITTEDNQTLSFSSEGEWALIEMFTRKGKLQKISNSHYQISFSQEGSSVTFQLKTSSTDNFFSAANDLHQFKCPASLMK